MYVCVCVCVCLRMISCRSRQRSRRCICRCTGLCTSSWWTGVSACVGVWVLCVLWCVCVSVCVCVCVVVWLCWVGVCVCVCVCVCVSGLSRHPPCMSPQTHTPPVRLHCKLSLCLCSACSRTLQQILQNTSPPTCSRLHVDTYV